MVLTETQGEILEWKRTQERPDQHTTDSNSPLYKHLFSECKKLNNMQRTTGETGLVTAAQDSLLLGLLGPRIRI